MTFAEFEEKGIAREVAFLGYLAKDFAVFFVVKVLGVFADVLHLVGPNAEGLMDLEVEANRFHALGVRSREW